MMDNFYKKLSSYLIRNHNINEDDGELYEYAAKVLFQGAVSIATTILLGAFIGMLKECLFFIFTFLILRKFAGGLHAKKFIYCFISSICLIVIALFTIKYLEKTSLQGPFLCIAAVSTIVICILSPVSNSNKPLLKQEKIIYKCISIVSSFLFLLITIFFIRTESLFSYSCGMALISVALLILIAYFKEKFIYEGKFYDS